jgi:hypothetical protein
MPLVWNQFDSDDSKERFSCNASPLLKTQVPALQHKQSHALFASVMVKILSSLNKHLQTMVSSSNWHKSHLLSPIKLKTLSTNLDYS